MLPQTIINKFSIQYHYAPKIPIEPTAFAILCGKKHGSDSWNVMAGLSVLLQQLVVFHLPLTTL